MSYSSPGRSEPKILVVDDEPANLRLLTDLLVPEGYEVQPALSGRLALSLMGHLCPDLILLDIMMPGMDGFEVCAELKRRPESRHIPIIFISALNDSSNKVKAFDAGGADYITKPFQIGEILARIRTQLSLLEANRALKEKEKFSRSLLESIDDGILGLDREGKAIFVNPAAAEQLGYQEDELIGQAIHEKIHYAYTDGSSYPAEDCPMYHSMHENRSVKVYDECLWHKNGSSFAVVYSCHPVYQNEQVIGSVVAFTDITELRQKEDRLRLLSVTDLLTGLFNRLQLDQVLATEVSRANRYDSVFSVILADIDNFKLVNDTHGHLVGDQVLKEVASTLQSRLRSTDTLGRWGGEEFMLICPETKLENAIQLAELLRVAIEATEFEGVGKTTISFGVSGFRKGDTGKELVARVDKALYRAKAAGKNRVEGDEGI